MKFDGIENIAAGGFGVDVLPVRSEFTFPVTNLITGLLVDHDTHGLCVYGSDGAWHKVDQQANP